MAVKDGLPSTDFSRMNREYIKEVAEGSAGSVLPEIAAADEGKFLGVVSGEAAWAEAGGGGGGTFDSDFFHVKLEDNPDYETDPSWTTRTVATAKEILDAMDAGKILIGTPGDSFNCGDAGNDEYYLLITNIVPVPSESLLYVNAMHFEHVDAADIATAHFIMDDNSLYQEWTVAMTPSE